MGSDKTDGRTAGVRILVDADACPVKQIIVKLAKEYGIPVIMFIDTSHVLNDGYSQVVTVDRSADSADLALINRAYRDDVVITQDYGVAALALPRGAAVLNQNGLIYTDNNIDELLFKRHLGQKVRRAGGRTKGPGKRTAQDDEHFEKALRTILEKKLKLV